jgi:hypothetical protein
LRGAKRRGNLDGIKDNCHGLRPHSNDGVLKIASGNKNLTLGSRLVYIAMGLLQPELWFKKGCHPGI